MSDTVDATAYLIVEGTKFRWDAESVPVREAKVAGVRAKKPASLTGNQVAVRLPKKAFEALQPEALIVVPEELVQHVVSVEAVEP